MRKMTCVNVPGEDLCIIHTYPRLRIRDSSRLISGVDFVFPPVTLTQRKDDDSPQTHVHDAIFNFFNH